MEIIEPCPRCGSGMKVIETPGNMKSFPIISLHCSNKECLWNMTCSYDELAGIDSKIFLKKIIKQWNEGVKKKI